MIEGPQEVIVRVGERSFYGVVRREFDNGDTQVTTEAAKLVGSKWESLVFDRRNEAIVGVAVLVIPSTMAEFAELARLAPARGN